MPLDTLINVSMIAIKLFKQTAVIFIIFSKLFHAYSQRKL